MAFKNLPILQGVLATAGPWLTFFARKGYRIYPFSLGTLVKTASTSTTLTVQGIGDFAANDYLMVASQQSFGNSRVFTPDETKVAKVLTVDDSTDTITVDTALTVSAGDYLFNLETDSGGSTPNYDGSSIVVYDDQRGDTVNANGYLTTGSGGSFLGWVSEGTLLTDLLITDLSDQPVSVLPKWTVDPQLPAEVGGRNQRIWSEGFYVDNIGANDSITKMTRATGAAGSPNAFVPMRSGSVTGIWVKSSETITAGTVTLTLYINNIVTLFTADLTTGTFKAETQDPGEYTFTEGQDIELYYTTASVTPAGSADLRAGLELEW